MSTTISPAFTRQKIAVDFASLRHACPKGIYVAPLPTDTSAWTGVLFVRKGPYANAILRFQIVFPDAYPQRPPTVTFQTDLFHPLVTPLTTYTYTTRDFGADTVSAADEGRLPPGGLSLRHGFPEWFVSGATTSTSGADARTSDVPQLRKSDGSTSKEPSDSSAGVPHAVEVLQYMRVIFETAEVLDSIPIEDVANAGAWHAWRSFRSRSLSSSTNTGSSKVQATVGGKELDTSKERAPQSPRQQPGGARRPGEWNWQGVWEDRVRKSVNGSISNPVLFGHENEVINFLKMDLDVLESISPLQGHPTTV